MSQVIKAYRIKNEDGLYSSGRFDPDFVSIEKSKLWRSIRALKLHLHGVREGNHYNNPIKPYPYDDCIVEIFEIQERKTGKLLDIDLSKEEE